ncbi:ragulator complex protein LAMTOR4 homolog [Sipha flava]|uniref:Late endosomal/lysosomal adaptor and MAPK and MTOR activator 4 n=1 Tax=Sipha flava TaxID=143950 RepID=A0A8B8GP68_9HEMI|nr:ragulator complex protein LAMTOR4 homolog [Sipha flava]
MERIPEQMGYLILTMDGAVISSGGDLENNERIADIIAKTISTSKSLYVPDEQFQNMSILYQYYHYSICVSNKKIHVSKIKHDPNALENEEVRVISESA